MQPSAAGSGLVATVMSESARRCGCFRAVLLRGEAFCVVWVGAARPDTFAQCSNHRAPRPYQRAEHRRVTHGATRVRTTEVGASTVQERAARAASVRATP
eukprot:7383632-Prymnesium_polylepis.2